MTFTFLSFLVLRICKCTQLLLFWSVLTVKFGHVLPFCTAPRFIWPDWRQASWCSWTAAVFLLWIWPRLASWALWWWSTAAFVHLTFIPLLYFLFSLGDFTHTFAHGSTSSFGLIWATVSSLAPGASSSVARWFSSSTFIFLWFSSVWRLRTIISPSFIIVLFYFRSTSRVATSSSRSTWVSTVSIFRILSLDKLPFSFFTFLNLLTILREISYTWFAAFSNFSRFIFTWKLYIFDFLDCFLTIVPLVTVWSRRIMYGFFNHSCFVIHI